MIYNVMLLDFDNNEYKLHCAFTLEALANEYVKNQSIPMMKKIFLRKTFTYTKSLEIIDESIDLSRYTGNFETRMANVIKDTIRYLYKKPGVFYAQRAYDLYTSGNYLCEIFYADSSLITDKFVAYFLKKFNIQILKVFPTNLLA
jgi:hypothetical protein